MRLRVVPIGLLGLAIAASCSSVAELDVGDRRETSIYLHCGAQSLTETIDGRNWDAIDLDVASIDAIPPDWPDKDTESERLDVTVELVAENQLLVTPVDGGTTIAYEPTDSARGCD